MYSFYAGFFFFKSKDLAEEIITAKQNYARTKKPNIDNNAFIVLLGYHIHLTHARYLSLFALVAS